ncbi:hypothetical protein BJI47_07715 [Rhodococcus sp. 1168]|nr:hypothetical protein BJI47_07715 [Rhodococcus sp. 1168]
MIVGSLRGDPVERVATGCSFEIRMLEQGCIRRMPMFHVKPLSVAVVPRKMSAQASRPALCSVWMFG